MMTHEILLLEIEQWLFYFTQVLQIVEESDKVKKQDEECNFSVQIVNQRFSVDDMNSSQNNIITSVEVGFLQLKILKEAVSSEQNKLIEQIKQKNDDYLDHILSNKPKQFVSYLFSQLEPEEKEYFQAYTLRELIDNAYKEADSYPRKTQNSVMSTRKKNIIQSLKEYIKKFREDQLLVIEHEGNIYNQFFLFQGEQNIHKLFAETVDRTEMMYMKDYANNFNNHNLSNILSESYGDHAEYYDDNRKYSLGGNDTSQISNYNNQIPTQHHHHSNNQSNNHHQHHTHHRNANNINGSSQVNYLQQEVDNQLLKAAINFLTNNSITNTNSNNNQQQQQEEILVTQVDNSQLTPNKNNSNYVEYLNMPYYLKKFKEQQLDEYKELLQRNKLYLNPSCIQIHKLLQINFLQSINPEQQQQAKEYGALMDRKDYCLKYLISEGYLFSVYQQVDIALKLVKSLNQIHNLREKRGSHCNLKPTNILLDTSYNVYLSDLGLDSKKNTTYYYSFENVYSNSLIMLKNKLKNQFLHIADSIVQASIENLKNNSISNGGNNQYHNLVGQPEAQFKMAFQQQQSTFYNQLADIQALGFILYELFTGQSITAESYYLKNHRLVIKRISQESPTPTLKQIFSIIFSLLELQLTSTEEIIPLFQEVYNKF